MAIKFDSLTKHGALQFLPSVSLAFEDPDVEDYMIACGWASKTNDPPVHTYTKDDIDIDPEGTKHNESGLLVSDIMEHGTVDKALAAGVTPRGPETLEPEDSTTEVKA